MKTHAQLMVEAEEVIARTRVKVAEIREDLLRLAGIFAPYSLGMEATEQLEGGRLDPNRLEEATRWMKEEIRGHLRRLVFVDPLDPLTQEVEEQLRADRERVDSEGVSR